MYMNAAEYLQEIRAANITLHNKRRELSILDTLIGASAIQYNPDRVQSSPRQDGLERQALMHLEKREKIQESIEQIIDFLHERIDEAVNYINELESEDQREVLMLRYIEQRSWADILDIRGCDDISGQYKLHKRALENLQQIINVHSMST